MGATAVTVAMPMNLSARIICAFLDNTRCIITELSQAVSIRHRKE